MKKKLWYRVPAPSLEQLAYYLNETAKAQKHHGMEMRVVCVCKDYVEINDQRIEMWSAFVEQEVDVEEE